MTLEIDRIADVTSPGGMPPYSPYGYIITSDGTIYTLLYQWYHGIILAVLYPAAASRAGYAAPVEPHEDNNVFEYQRFELDNAPVLNVVRVSMAMSGLIYFSKGNAAATTEQLTAVTTVAKVLGIKGRGKIQTEYGEVPLSEVL